MIIWIVLVRQWNHAGSLRGGVAIMVALFSLSVLWQLERATLLRQKLIVNDAINEWLYKRLASPFTISASCISELKEEAGKSRRTDTELQIARRKLALAMELKQHDEKIEAQVAYRLQREQDEREHKASQAIKEVARKAEDAAQAAAKKAKDAARMVAIKARERELRIAINNSIRSSPTVSTIDELHEGNEAVIDDNLWAVNWDRFTNFATRALQPKAKGQLTMLLQELPGVTLCDGVKLQLQYKGAIGHGDCNESNGYCDAYAIVDGEALPLYEGIRFSESSEGIINAFLLTACLPGQWSWGHVLTLKEFRMTIREEDDGEFIIKGTLIEGPDICIYPTITSTN